jgi:hypothetical protein
VYINVGRFQPPEVFIPSPRIDRVHGLFAAFQAFFNERKKSPIGLLTAIEEGANVSSIAEV